MYEIVLTITRDVNASTTSTLLACFLIEPRFSIASFAPHIKSENQPTTLLDGRHEKYAGLMRSPQIRSTIRPPIL